MRIAVSGCGITGTAVAYFLAASGHEVVVFEQSRICGPVGAGLLLQPSGQAVLQEMGLLSDLEAKSQRLDGMQAIRRVGTNLWKSLVRLQYQWLEPNCYALGVHRGTLFELLLEACLEAGAKVITNARVESVIAVNAAAGNGKIRVQFSKDHPDEPFGEFDFLIAADGSKSLLRQSCQIHSKSIEYDYAALWATGPCDFQSNELFQVVDGTQRLVGLLPIGDGKTSYFWGFRASEYEKLTGVDFAEWRKDAIQFCPESESLLLRFENWEQFTFARYRHVSLKIPYTENVIFLGDAAHATSPHLGQGVNLGLEDAICFAKEVDKLENFPNACRSFFYNRKRKLRYYQQLTRLLSPFFQSDGRLKGVLRDVFLPWLPRLPVVRREMLRTLCGTKNGWFA
ncbi:MAG: NAD(P)/FAD-dependent oxidoreductase [Pirellulaceae bacterium]|nr:NAD(P)/FAD-dependent oxidoreductase [Pirellulaceae bacterium]